MSLENVVTEYSLWYTPLCLLAGLAYAAILYFRETKNEFPSPLRWAMAVLRALVVTGISFLLLNPLLRSVRKYADKPLVVVLQDNSSSLMSGRDSAFYRG